MTIDARGRCQCGEDSGIAGNNLRCKTIRAAVPEEPARELVPMGSGVQSSSDRKSKEEEGGSEISTKGKEDSSNSA
jgi:hypothetical protein